MDEDEEREDGCCIPSPSLPSLLTVDTVSPPRNTRTFSHTTSSSRKDGHPCALDSSSNSWNVRPWEVRTPPSVRRTRFKVLKKNKKKTAASSLVYSLFIQACLGGARSLRGMFGFLEASLTLLCVQHARERRAADYERARRGTPAAVGVEVNGKVGSSKCEVNDKEATPSTTLLSLPPSPAHRFSHPHPGRDEKGEAGHRVVKSRLAPPLVLEKVGGEPIPRVFRVMPVVGANLVRLLWETMENVKFLIKQAGMGNDEEREEGTAYE